MRRFVWVLLVLSAVACTRGLGEAGEALRSPPSPSPPPTPSRSSGAPVGSIVVRSPLEDDEVVSPVVVSGTARTEDGTVFVRLLDQGGAELAAIEAGIDCGVGCRGSFRAPLVFFVEAPTPGIVQVAEVDPEGQAIQLTEVRATFIPGV